MHNGRKPETGAVRFLGIILIDEDVAFIDSEPPHCPLNAIFQNRSHFQKRVVLNGFHFPITRKTVAVLLFAIQTRPRCSG